MRAHLAWSGDCVHVRVRLYICTSVRVSAFVCKPGCVCVSRVGSSVYLRECMCACACARVKRRPIRFPRRRPLPPSPPPPPPLTLLTSPFAVARNLHGTTYSGPLPYTFRSFRFTVHDANDTTHSIDIRLRVIPLYRSPPPPSSSSSWGRLVSGNGVWEAGEGSTPAITTSRPSSSSS